jgi:hypothetical protein
MIRIACPAAGLARVRLRLMGDLAPYSDFKAASCGIERGL